MNNPFLRSLKVIWSNPKFVFINKENLKKASRELGANFLKNGIETPSWKMPIFPENPEEFMKFILVANSINFCFTDPWSKERFAINYKGQLWRDSLAMAACLKRALAEEIPLYEAHYLENLKFSEVEYIFRHDEKSGETPMPLLKERWENLKNLGLTVNKKFDGDMLNIFRASKFYVFNQGRGLVEILVKNFSSYYDAAVHPKLKKIIHFHKRAQLLAMVYQGRALSDPSWPFPLLSDASNIGPPADYIVPAVLWKLRILNYEPSLISKIKNGEIIPRNSEEEIEIRAMTIKAMIELLENLKIFLKSKLGEESRISIIQLDYKIWQMGSILEIPHHLTPTTAY